MRKGKPIIAGMATMPGREAVVHDAVASLMPQVDRIYLTANPGFDKEKAGIKNAAKVYFYQSSKDFGDAAKFRDLGFCQFKLPHGFYFLSCDDDLIYPRDYAEVLLSDLDQLGGVVGLHGVRLKHPVKSYYRDREVFHFRHKQFSAHGVDILGTGVCAWDSTSVGFTMADTDAAYPNMGDLHLAAYCKRNGIPMTVAPHRTDWVKQNPKTDLENTIYAQSKGKDQLQTELIKKVWENH